MVTVLLTCYNHIQYLPQAFQCLLDQTYGDFEILALDDGSTDGTREWLKEQTDPRLRCIFHEQNLGTYGSLNVGVREARGEYVAVLNDDDLWSARKLEEQVAAFEKDPEVGLVHTNGWFIDDSGERHPDPEPMGFPYPVPTSRDMLPVLLHQNMIIASSVMLRRSVFERCGTFDPEFYGCGDWHMWLRVATHFKVVFLEEPLTFYRVHATNAAWNSKKMLQDDVRLRQWATHSTDVKGRADREPAVYRALAHNWACLGTGQTLLGRPAEGRRAYARSIRLMPGRVKSYLRWLSTFAPRKPI